MTTTNIVDNPYVGPRSFEKEDRRFFFGREREGGNLLSLVLSNQLVLFYAPSGAGKSSLLKAHLVPCLEDEGFKILPIGRVSGELVGVTEVYNIFVFNLLLKLDQGQRAAGSLIDTALTDFLKAAKSPVLPKDGPKERPRVLIIDQFEEIFTAHPDHWQERENFFQQLRQAIVDDPHLWVILSMREDYLAALEPYGWLLPDKLRARFHMQRMGHQAARAAIEKPAGESGLPFNPEAAKALVESLAKIRLPGRTEPPSGQFIEPLQLQVVCYQLWEELNGHAKGEISRQDLQKLDVDKALAQFYDDIIARTIGQYPDLSEIDLRGWFEEQLITEAGTRSMVFRGPDETEGLPNRAVDFLADKFLIRAEARTGGTWYELVHDSLIEPILKANRDWRLAQDPLTQAALIWQEKDWSEEYLYRGQQLKDALANIKGQIQESLVAEFLEASQEFNQQLEAQEAWRQQELEAQRARAEDQARTARRLRRLTTALAVVIVFAVVTAILAIRQSQIAEIRQAEAEQQQQIAQSRDLAAQAVSSLEAGQLDLALLLSVEANQPARTVEASHILLQALQFEPRLTTFLHIPEAFGQSIAFSLDGQTVAFSPDGQTLAAVSVDGAISLWDTTSGKQTSLTAHIVEVNNITFSPDGQTLAAASVDGAISLWDITSGAETALISHKVGGSSIAFSPDSQTLAAASVDGAISLWDITSGKQTSLAAHTAAINNLTFSRDGQTLAAGGADGAIILWDLNIHEPLNLAADNTTGVNTIAFSPDDRTLASGNADGVITLWDIATGKQTPLIGHTAGVNSIAFSPDGQTLASGSDDYTIILWEVATGQPIGLPLRGRQSPVISVSFNSNKPTTLQSINEDQTAILWDVTAQQRLGQPLINYPQQISTIAFSRNGQMLALGSSDGSIILWELAADQPRHPPLTGQEAAVTSLAFNPDGQTLASGHSSGAIVLWDIATGQPRRPPLTGHMADVKSITFSLDGQTLASSDAAGAIILWDVTESQPRHPALTDLTPVNSLAFSPDNQLLASGNEGGFIILWDVASGESLDPPLIGHRAGVTGVAFSPDSQILASGSVDGTIILWDIVTGKQTFLSGHTAAVSTVIFSPDGHILASGSVDSTIILWDVAQGRPLGPPLPGHTAAVNSMAFSQDGLTMVSSDDNKTIMRWDVNLASWPALACRIANRNLTWPEWTQFLPPERTYHLTCPELPLHPSFIEAGRELARHGKAEEAEAQFRQALALNPGLPLDPKTEITKGMVEGGQELVRLGYVEAARAQFQQARELDPSLRLDLEAEIQQWSDALAQFNDGLELARVGNVDEALAQLQRALDLDPSLAELNPKAEMAQSLITGGDSLAQQSQVEQAKIAYEQAGQLDPSLESSALFWNRLCRLVIWGGNPAEVIDACERAAALAPEDGWMRNDWGVARALTGDFAGAIDDFKFFVEWARENNLYELYGPRREAWISELAMEENPFDADTLKELQNE